MIMIMIIISLSCYMGFIASI